MKNGSAPPAYSPKAMISDSKKETSTQSHPSKLEMLHLRSRGGTPIDLVHLLAIIYIEHLAKSMSLKAMLSGNSGD
jgi:hypothetical protein